jgi:hypothetical protein
VTFVLPRDSPATERRAFEARLAQIDPSGGLSRRVTRVETNGVFEVRDGRHIAYVPSYDLPELDTVAHATYRRLGWEVVPIQVRALFPYHGTIGCVVNVVERRRWPGFADTRPDAASLFGLSGVITAAQTDRQESREFRRR